MSMNEPRSIHASEDWGVVLQSVPSKNRKGIVKRLGEIFGLDKRDAEQILSNMPLILVDNLSFGLAARIKKFFQTVGAVAETTNHDMIKKNCFQVLWPQTPDLSFFLKNETGPTEAPGPEKKSPLRGTEIPPTVVSFENAESKPEIQRTTQAPQPVWPSHESPKVVPQHSPVPLKPVQEPPAIVSHHPPVPPKPVQEPPAIVSHHPPVPPAPIQESPAIVSQPFPVFEEKPVPPLSSGVDLDWERRAKELNEKLRKFHEEKKELHVQHVEATEKVKNEFQQQIEEEKQKRDEIARKAQEDLQREAQKHEALTREGEEWRSKAIALEEKVRDLEANLAERTSAVEHLVQQKDNLAHQVEKTIAESQQELSALRSREAETQQAFSDFRGREAETQQELATLRGREQESSQKIGGLERTVQEMTESLRSRDAMLAQFEKQISELAEKTQGFEALRHEHGQLSRERATIRQGYDAKLSDQEVRLAKVEEDNRRYRSRMDRKNAAATRELGEWIRGLDTIRQGLQKLILFLGSDSAVLDTEKKSNLRSPLTRGPDSPTTEKS